MPFKTTPAVINDTEIEVVIRASASGFRVVAVVRHPNGTAYEAVVPAAVLGTIGTAQERSRLRAMCREIWAAGARELVAAGQLVEE